MTLRTSSSPQETAVDGLKSSRRGFRSLTRSFCRDCSCNNTHETFKVVRICAGQARYGQGTRVGPLVVLSTRRRWVPWSKPYSHILKDIFLENFKNVVHCQDIQPAYSIDLHLTHPLRRECTAYSSFNRHGLSWSPCTSSVVN